MSQPWSKYAWARSKEKLERAVAQLEAKGKKYKESDVKDLYLSFGGAVVDATPAKKKRVSKKK